MVQPRGGRYWRGVAGGVHWAPEKLPIRAELGAVLFSGPSWLLAPRVEWQAARTLAFELGAALVGGPSPGPLGAPNVAVGGLFSNVSQVFTGVRWSP